LIAFGLAAHERFRPFLAEVYHSAERLAMDCEQLKSSVLGWFGSEMECRVTGDDCLTVTLPILKPNGDPIELGIEATGQRMWRVSDLGETYATLFLAGVELNDEYVRAEEFRRVVVDHRITETDQELSVETSGDRLVETVFDLVQAVQSMLALQLTVKPKQVSRDFSAIVAKFFAEQRTSFEIPPGPIEGKTGRWNFNFVLNHVRPETLVKAVTANSKAAAMRQAEQSVFEISDVRELRNADAIVIADDEGSRSELWQPSVLRIFSGYDIPLISFEAKKDELIRLAQRYAY
jgi:hypothetical protein